MSALDILIVCGIGFFAGSVITAFIFRFSVKSLREGDGGEIEIKIVADTSQATERILLVKKQIEELQQSLRNLAPKS